MRWFRMDATMPLNAKVGELSDGDFRALVALWSFCSRKRNGGHFSAQELRHVVYTSPKGARHVKPAQLERFCEVSLVVSDGDAYKVNDWDVYQPTDPTGAERQKRWRDNRA